MIYSLYILRNLYDRSEVDNIAIPGKGNMDNAENYFSKKYKNHELKGYFVSFVKYIDTFDMDRRKKEQLRLF